jgi:hypothetical protein
VDAPAFLRLWHLTSLDAPTVAVVWALGFAWVLGERLPPLLPVLLALVVWVIYVADRLLDSHAGQRAGQIEGLRARHAFHWKHRWILGPLAAAATCAAAGLVLLWMPAMARERSTVLAAAALAYFTRVHSSQGPVRAPFQSSFLTPFLTKELLVGVLFAAGCALPAWNRAPAAPWPLAAPVVFFAALAWLNCHAIECWESGEGSPAGPIPRAEFGVNVSHPCAGRKAQGWGTEHWWLRRNGAMRKIETLGFTLGLAAILAAVGLSAPQPRPAALLLAGAASALLLALLDRLRGDLTPLALRAAADLALLTPLALLWR